MKVDEGLVIIKKIDSTFGQNLAKVSANVYKKDVVTSDYMKKRHEKEAKKAPEAEKAPVAEVKAAPEAEKTPEKVCAIDKEDS